MKRHIVKSIISVVVVCATVNSYASFNKVIHGSDDRQEVADYGDRVFREHAKSVAGMVRTYELYDDSKNFFSYSTGKTLMLSQNVCEAERFSNQPVLPRCTGFLVSPDTLVTAGHCVTSQSDCNNFSWVFGFEKGVEEIAKKDVYKCEKVLGQKLTLGLFSTKDYAVVKLRRVVKDRAPLKFRKKGNPKKGSEVIVIGHPSGLPMKIADNGKITKKRINFFETDLDTYGGNSGSPVFNAKNGIVEGILIRGEEDFELRGSCYMSRSSSKGREKVFKIKKIKEIKDL